MGVNERSAIITGAGRGIGRAVALRLAVDGCRVALFGPVDGELRAVADEATASGGTAVVVVGDVTSPDDVQRLVESIDHQWGRIDVLVNNAGRFDHQRPMTELTLSQWDDILRVNATGTFLCSREVAAVMIRNRAGGRIVNIGAIQAWSPLPGWAAYAASKGAVDSLTRAMAVELAGHGILVNAVAPGGVDVRTDAVREDLEATLLRRLGHPHEVAELVAFLASPRNTFVVGETVRCDGGRLLMPRQDHQRPS